MDYITIRNYTKEEAAAALANDDLAELRVIVIGLSLHCADREFVERFSLATAKHPDEIVKGNSLLAFSHLARRFRRLNSTGIKELIELALTDPSTYVRGQAFAAADDVTHFLGWKLAGFDG